MKSGLEGRNNSKGNKDVHHECCCLNEVRPGRPEQSKSTSHPYEASQCLNEVRPGRPEQFELVGALALVGVVSMKSGLEGRNNASQYARMFDASNPSQ